MAYLKSDFIAAFEAAVVSRPTVAAAYRAGDPRLIAQIEAMATMMAMFSQQVDVAEAEPFVKSRVGTVLADATLKGVLPLARVARVQITVTNPGATAVTLAAGRQVLDGKGRAYTIEGAATVPAGGAADITALQVTTRQITHTVSASAPFYSVMVPASDAGQHLAGLDVADASGAFAYTPDFCNVAPGARVFHVETDEYRRVWVRFGASDAAGTVVGHQPANGDVLTITVRECDGKIDDLEAGAVFGLGYVAVAAERDLQLALKSVLSAGAQPPDTEVLRLLARYPALHDSNAVYLADFDFLLRRHLGSAIEFLSVWNEQIEEAVRGASVLNINKLFVSFKISGQTAVVSEAQIRQLIGRADDSYKVQIVERREVPVPIIVSAAVSVVHDPGDVEAQIRAALLSQYGAGSLAASRGLQNTFRYQLIHQLLTERVVALQDQLSDFSVVLGETPSPLPEDYRYLTPGSITVAVTRVQSTTGLWGT